MDTRIRDAWGNAACLALVGALVALLVVVTLVVRPGTRPDDGARPEPDVGTASVTAHGTHSSRERARAVLRRWDRRRAAAWEAGDAAALARLYAPGSLAGLRDIRALRRWTARGLRVRGLAMQVLELRVLREASGQLTLRVVDRLVVSAPALPRDTATARVIHFVRTDGAPWQVAEVRPG